MNAVAKLTPETGTNIVALVEASPVLVLTDREKFSAFYEAMKAECDAHVPDLTTGKGRKEIASLAHKVARTKTAIDDAGKKLNEEARARINAVDESRREIRTQLDALKAEVRRPLTEWEEAEADRVDKCEQTLVLLRDSAKVGFEETAEDVRKRIAHVEGLTFEPEFFQGYAPQAQALRASTIETLTGVAERMDREEAERLELERLRADAARREAEEQAKRETEEAERQRAEREAAAAEARARQEAEAKAKEERDAAERAHAEALAAEKRRADEAEAAANAERDRIAREEAEQKAREADRAHRGKIMREAKEAIITCGVEETVAKAIVIAIAANNVPHISIRF